MIKMPKEVTVPAGSKKTVQGEISLPDGSFNGILMAGLHISEKKTSNEHKTVSNTVAYNIPFVVRGNIDKRPSPEIQLTKVSLQKYSRTQSSLDVSLSNLYENLLKESEFHTEIKDNRGKTMTENSSKLDITPETSFIYPVKLPNQISEGTYTMRMTVTHGKDKWEFEKEFTISKEEAKAISKQSLIKPTPWLLISIIGGVLAFFFSMIVWIWIVIRRRKQQRNTRSRVRKKRRW